MSNFFASCSFCLPRQCRLPKQAINLHDLTVLIEETGAYPTAVLCRIERFLADLQFAAARSLCRMYCGSKTILVTAIHATRIGFFRRC